MKLTILVNQKVNLLKHIVHMVPPSLLCFDIHSASSWHGPYVCQNILIHFPCALLSGDLFIFDKSYQLYSIFVLPLCWDTISFILNMQNYFPVGISFSVWVLSVDWGKELIWWITPTVYLVCKKATFALSISVSALNLFFMT